MLGIAVIMPRIHNVVITQHFCWVIGTWVSTTLGIEEVGYSVRTPGI